MSFRALFSASDDCQPESFAVPVIEAASKLGDPAAPEAPAAPLAGAAGEPAPVPVDGAVVAPVVQAPAIIMIEAPRANTVRRIGVLLHEAHFVTAGQRRAGAIG